MSLREVALETLSNYNPATDNPNQSENIPVGEYDVAIDKADFRVYESGYDCIAVTCKVVGGDYDGREELININVAPNYKVNKEYPFILKKNIKLIGQLLFACDLEPSDEDWEEQHTLGEFLRDNAIGKQFVLQITESKNKKDPSNPYRNYQFIKYAEDDYPF